MNSMASINGFQALHCPEAQCRAQRDVQLMPTQMGLSHGRVKKSLVAKANAGGYKGVRTVNGKKVNGVGVEQVMANETELMDQSNGSSAAWLSGRFLDNRNIYRQTFVIRSYEIGPDRTATMETLMNLLQETALNQVRSSGLYGNGFGATHEMSLRKLIWVVTRIHVQVEKYSSWGDVVEIDTWVNAAGKNGMRRDWIIKDYKTQKVITKATSTWVIMNRETRKLSKIPEEVRREVQPFYVNRDAIPLADVDGLKIEKLTDQTADIVRSGLAPRWSDMDANQHVNNVKYIGWILESVPIEVLEDYNMTRLTLEYRRECRQSNLLKSLTSMTPNPGDDPTQTQNQTRINNEEGKEALACTHLLCMEEDKAEIVRARSVWRPKQKNPNPI